MAYTVIFSGALSMNVIRTVEETVKSCVIFMRLSLAAAPVPLHQRCGRSDQLRLSIMVVSSNLLTDQDRTPVSVALFVLTFYRRIHVIGMALRNVRAAVKQVAPIHQPATVAGVKIVLNPQIMSGFMGENDTGIFPSRPILQNTEILP